MAAPVDDSQKWRDAEAEILQRLDITSEFLELGVRIVNSTPTSKGWLQCHAVDREDSSASAGVNVGDGPQRGLYRDHGGLKPAVNFFNLAAQLKGMERKEVRKYYATKTSVKLPTSEDKYWREKFSLSPLTVGLALLYSRGKGGVEAQSLFDLGGQAAVWPLKIPPEKANHMIAFPAYGAAGVDSEPCGWHCVSANPQLKIHQYQGPGKPPKDIKTMWIGSAGLLGLHGANLDNIKRVWFVEGISDLLAARSWMSADEIAITTGGCQSHIKPEVAQWFAGKDCCVVYDVGDSEDQGQVNAAVMCANLLPFASSVRRVVLPMKNGKNDLRQWKMDGGTFDQLCKMADETLPVLPQSKEAEAKVEDAVLQDFGCMVLSLHADNSIDLYGKFTRRITTVKDINRFSINHAILALGASIKDKLSDKKDPGPGLVYIGDLQNAISCAASDAKMSKYKTVGAGVWPADDKFLVVGNEDWYLYDPTGGEWHHQESPQVNGMRVYPSSVKWFDARTLGHYCRCAGDAEWRINTWREIEGLFAQWNNWEHASNATIVAAMSMASWVQSCWKFRPMLAVTGPSNSGKSTLIKHTLPEFFGGDEVMARYFAKPSAAGIRQDIGTTSRIIVIDELEDDGRHREEVLRMLRASTSGGEIVRGTSHQVAKGSGLCHMVWLASVNLKLAEAADKNRYIKLELKEVPAGTRGGIKINSNVIRDLGMKALAISLRRFHNWNQSYAEMKMDHLAKFEHQEMESRMVELYMMPAVIAADVSGWSPEETQVHLANWLKEREIKAENESDEEAVLKEIYSSIVNYDGGMTTTIGTLLGNEGVYMRNAALPMDPSSKLTLLGKYGIGCINDGVLFNCPIVEGLLLKASQRFRMTSLVASLKRLEGHYRVKRTIPGQSQAHCSVVPYSTLERITGIKHFGNPDRSDILPF